MGVSNVLSSNLKINSVEDAINASKNLMMSMNNTVRGDYQTIKKHGLREGLNKAFTKPNGNFNWKKAGGYYAAGAVGARVLSGGGITRDGRGNHDIVGIPFI